MRFFFYGTLQDIPLLECVIGHDVSGLSSADAWVEGFAARRAVNETFPVLVEAPGARLAGVLMEGLSGDDMARIRFFEDSFYEAARVTAHTAAGPETCEMFLLTDAAQATDEPWTLKTWAERDRAVLRHMAAAFIALMGRMTYEEADKHWENIRAAAVSAVDAAGVAGKLSAGGAE